jgi:lysine 6-dehydrogenase
MSAQSLVVVLGAAGETGSLAAERIVKGGRFDAVRLVDVNEEGARKVAARLNHPAISVVKADARDRASLDAAVVGAHTVINTIGPYFIFGRACIEAVLDAGAHYVDVNDEIDATLAFFDDAELSARFLAKAKTAVIGLGTSPGMTNIFVAEGARQMDTVDEVQIRLVSNSRYRAPAVMYHRLHVLSSGATVLRDGQLQVLPARSEPEVIEFPVEPGRGTCFIVGHPEPITLARHIPGLRNADVKLGYVPDSFNDIMQQIFDLGLVNDEPIQVGDTKVSIAKVAAAYFGSSQADHLFNVENATANFGRQIRVIGKKNGVDTRVIYRIGGTNSTRITGYLPVVAAELLLADGVDAKGLVAPELLPTEPFLKEVLALGVVCDVVEEQSRQLTA